MKFIDIRKSDACSVRSSKFNLGAAVSGLCFQLMLLMKEHTTTNKLFLEKSHELILISNSPNTNVACGSVCASKIG